MIGILNGSIVIWIVFSLSYTALCVAISFKIYFMNYVVEGLLRVKENIKNQGFCSNAFIPIRRGNYTKHLYTVYLKKGNKWVNPLLLICQSLHHIIINNQELKLQNM